METKLCTKCGVIKPTSEFYRRTQVKCGYQSHCKECVCKWRKNVYYKIPEVQKACKDASNKSYAKARAELIAAYGGACCCCGETEPKFLSVEHVNGDGAAHRKVIGEGGKTLCNFLRRNGYPKDGYSLLCYNCNCAKGFFGVCPHETTRQLLAVSSAATT